MTIQELIQREIAEVLRKNIIEIQLEYKSQTKQLELLCFNNETNEPIVKKETIFANGEKDGSWEYFELKILVHNNKKYVLVWLLNDDIPDFLGIIHCRYI